MWPRRLPRYAALLAENTHCHSTFTFALSVTVTYDLQSQNRCISCGQGHREFPIWNWKITTPAAKQKLPKIPVTENSFPHSKCYHFISDNGLWDCNKIYADTVDCCTALCYSRIDIPQKPNRYPIFNNQYRYQWGFEFWRENTEYRQLNTENSVGYVCTSVNYE